VNRLVTLGGGRGLCAAVPSASTVSSTRSLTIGGQVLGTMGGADSFAITAEKVATLKVGGATITLTAGGHNDDVFLDLTGDFDVREV
jgi:hypothetical protein